MKINKPKWLPKDPNEWSLFVLCFILAILLEIQVVTGNPNAREVLHQSKVFNPMNAAHPISYDHLLNARRFSSVIVREENIYGNRAISDYVRGNSLFQLLEANKIKEEIRNREIDMWNY